MLPKECFFSALTITVQCPALTLSPVLVLQPHDAHKALTRNLTLESNTKAFQKWIYLQYCFRPLSPKPPLRHLHG